MVAYYPCCSEKLPSLPSLSQLHQEMNSGTCVGQGSWRTAGGKDLRRLSKTKGQGTLIAESSEVQDKVRSWRGAVCVKGG